MIHLHGAVSIDEDERSPLVVERRGERDAELRRRDGEAALRLVVLRVERRNPRAPRVEIARRLQLLPDPLDAVRFLDGLPVMRGLPDAVEVALADDVRRDRQALRRLRQDVFDGDHRLRTAETAERGLRRLVRAADAAGRFDVGQVVRVVAVKERPPHDRLRQIEAEPAVGEERDAQRLDLPARRKSRRVANEIWMALPGQRHVELARQPHANGTAGLPRAERGDRGPRVCLHLLAAKRAAHAQAFDGHVLARQPEHARDDLLRFRRMLRGRLRPDSAGLVDPRDCRLRLEIEVFLTADCEFAVDAHGARLDRRDIPARQPEGVGEEASGLDRLLDRQDRGQRFVFDANARAGETSPRSGTTARHGATDRCRPRRARRPPSAS